MGNRNADLAARRAYEVSGYELYFDRNADLGIEVYATGIGGDYLLAKCFVGKAGKPTWFYRFRSQDDLDAQIARTVKGRESSLEYKAKRRAEQAAPVDVAVGDVFEAMWGYDQTNIDYYQVTRIVGPKTVEVRPIARVAWETAHMQGRCVPSVDNFIGRPMVKRVKSAGSEGAAIRINSFCDAYKMKPVVDGAPVYASSMWTAYA